MNILVIEDEKRLARLLTLELMHEGYEAEAIYDGESGLDMAINGKWDLILLDVMLPGLSGLEVLRRYRRLNSTTPIIMLTARNEVPDRVSGLDLGANDYLSKPFETEELLARIRVQLRSQPTSEEQKENAVLEFEGLRLDPRTREVYREDTHIELTRREFDLLQYLLANQGQVLEREQLIQTVWGYDYYGDTNVVDVYIRYLRKKIDADHSPLIHTVRGIGYVLKKASV
ncbi:two-component response regulator [Geomicrobium sp. JCM 19037]|uniref:response regulator transcription factor n=1 Tax=Geomicrobium sp. JCM 19037 TaxID=1460634 RepID=UPI00045F4B30|nr:response regulator transcription factor [Geomicrobium sp. JCM 19037]GAK03747.1 two-component response regulator [Geomicrobium sp. JCM 19037]